jgi:hypothetical protein
MSQDTTCPARTDEVEQTTLDSSGLIAISLMAVDCGFDPPSATPPSKNETTTVLSEIGTLSDRTRPTTGPPNAVESTMLDSSLC